MEGMEARKRGERTAGKEWGAGEEGKTGRKGGALDACPGTQAHPCPRGRMGTSRRAPSPSPPLALLGPVLGAREAKGHEWAAGEGARRRIWAQVLAPRAILGSQGLSGACLWAPSPGALGLVQGPRAGGGPGAPRPSACARKGKEWKDGEKGKGKLGTREGVEEKGERERRKKCDKPESSPGAPRPSWLPALAPRGWML